MPDPYRGICFSTGQIEHVFMVFIRVILPFVSMCIVVPKDRLILGQLDSRVVRVTNRSHLVPIIQFQDFPDIEINPSSEEKSTLNENRIRAGHREGDHVFFDEMVECAQAGVMDADVVLEGVPPRPVTAQLLWLLPTAHNP